MAGTNDSAAQTSASDGLNIEAGQVTGTAAGTQTAGKTEVGTGTNQAQEAAGNQHFTQADIDRIVKQRVKQAQEAAKAAADEEAAKKAGEYEKLYASESEKAKALTLQLKSTALKYEVAVIAARLNIQKTDIALKLIDLDAVEYDTEGKPTNIEALLQAVIKELPSLVVAQAAQEDASKVKATSTGGSINTQRTNAAANQFDPRNPPRLTDSALWSAPVPKRGQ